MVIARTDRVSTVIARDASLIDVFVSLAPAFERLRNPGMRRVMARLVTVEQAARMAGVDADELVSRLNAHGGGDAAVAPGGASAKTPVARSEPLAQDEALGQSEPLAQNEAPGQSEPRAQDEALARPDALARIPAERVIQADVREELRNGREPFSIIMAALRTVPEGGALAVRAIFEPVPLYAVMKQQGLAHWTESLASDDWRVWFFASAPASAPAAAEEGETGEPAAADAADNVVVLDVRGLEPPEPMTRTLAALEQLPRGATLVQINVRVPQFLLPLLEQRGFTYDVREQEPGLVRVFIRHGSNPE